MSWKDQLRNDSLPWLIESFSITSLPSPAARRAQLHRIAARAYALFFQSSRSSRGLR